MIPKTMLAGHATEEAVASALTRDEGDAPIALSLHKGAAASLQARAKGVAKTKPGLMSMLAGQSKLSDEKARREQIPRPALCGAHS